MIQRQSLSADRRVEVVNEEKKTDPGNRSVRNVLRVVGPVVMVSGMLLTLTGVASFSLTFGGSEPPKWLWMPFAGMPLFFVGRILYQFGYMDKPG